MANSHSGQPLIPPRGKTFRLGDYSPGHNGGTDREVVEAELAALRIRLDALQNLMYAGKQHALLVVLQGIDTSGKDSTINSVFQVAGPLGCTVVNFGVPSTEEAAHDHLWRYHQKTPEMGKVVIFNRSHYESVLVERVKGLATREQWSRRYDHINQFERILDDEGTVVMKFFLHISNEEQRERLQERVDNPKKHWKFRAGDLEERKLWDDYQDAFEDMIEQCNTEWAPWHVVPANRKWYRDYVVAKALVGRLESLGMTYPEAPDGVAGMVVA